MFTEVQAYNLILAATGDAPIDSLTNNPYVVQLINPFIEANRRMVLAFGMASNVDKQTLQPDINGVIVVPEGFLRVRFPAGMDYLVVRNHNVWNTSTMENHAEAIDVLATRDIAFDELDELTQMWIINLCARDYRRRSTGEWDSSVAFYDREATSCKQRACNKDSYNSVNMNGWGRAISVYGG